MCWAHGTAAHPPLRHCHAPNHVIALGLASSVSCMLGITHPELLYFPGYCGYGEIAADGCAPSTAAGSLVFVYSQVNRWPRHLQSSKTCCTRSSVLRNQKGSDQQQPSACCAQGQLLGVKHGSAQSTCALCDCQQSGEARYATKPRTSKPTMKWPGLLTATVTCSGVTCVRRKLAQWRQQEEQISSVSST